MSNWISIPTLFSLLSIGIGRLPYKRNRAIFSLSGTILVFLTYNILSTMQCSTSRPQSQNHISIVNVPRESDSSNSLDSPNSFEILTSSEVAEIAEPQEQTGEPFFRAIRDGVVTESPRLCGDRLRFALMKLCQRKFHEPLKAQSSTRTRKRSTIVLRRIPRTVVDECCKMSCNETVLLKYCNGGNGPRPQHINSSQTVERLLDEVNVTDKKEQGSNQNSTENGRHEMSGHEQETGPRSNAVTQTLPKKMIPLGSLINDYRIQSVANVE